MRQHHNRQRWMWKYKDPQEEARGQDSEFPRQVNSDGEEEREQLCQQHRGYNEWQEGRWTRKTHSAAVWLGCSPCWLFKGPWHMYVRVNTINMGGTEQQTHGTPALSDYFPFVLPPPYRLLSSRPPAARTAAGGWHVCTEQCASSPAALTAPDRAVLMGAHDDWQPRGELTAHKGHISARWDRYGGGKDGGTQPQSGRMQVSEREQPRRTRRPGTQEMSKSLASWRKASHRWRGGNDKAWRKAPTNKAQTRTVSCCFYHNSFCQPGWISLTSVNPFFLEMSSVMWTTVL